MNAPDPRAMRLRAESLASRALSLSPAESTEAVVSVTHSALTRFAENRIHQNVAEENATVSVRAVYGKRTGVAATNRVDDESLRACCEAAAAAARSAPEDAEFPGLPAGVALDAVDRVAAGTVGFDASARATAVRSIVDQSSSRDLTCAGGIEASLGAVAVANTLGASGTAASSSLRATVLSMGREGGSGWASFVSRDAAELAAAALGDEAATIAERSERPGSLDPGSYTVVLAPEAVADLVDFLGWLGCGAKPFAEGRSFMSGHLGERIVSDRITLVDDALAPHAFGPTFDYEGVAKRRVPLIRAGVAEEFVTDSYWAGRTSRPDTGHALPAPNEYGPMPMNLEMAAGDATIDELIAEVVRGVYVTRFHYVNVENPVPVTLTGMTRDGTFMIENGRLTRPLKNLRFTQSVIEALGDVRGVTSERRWIGSETAPVLVPGLLLGSFAFTGQTA